MLVNHFFILLIAKNNFASLHFFLIYSSHITTLVLRMCLKSIQCKSFNDTENIMLLIIPLKIETTSSEAFTVMTTLETIYCLGYCSFEWIQLGIHQCWVSLLALNIALIWSKSTRCFLLTNDITRFVVQQYLLLLYPTIHYT